LVYVDESGIDTYLYNPYGYSVGGEKIYGEISGRRYDRESFIAAEIRSKVIASVCFGDTYNSELFNLWLEHFLIPELNPGQIVIMHNAAFHKSNKTIELIESYKCKHLSYFDLLYHQ
jgi:hypothetical protein